MNKRHKNDGLRKICTCSQRQWSRCQHAWHISFKHGDVHYRGSLDRLLGRHVETKDDAKGELDKVRTLIRDKQPGSVDDLRMLIRGVTANAKTPATADAMTLEAFGKVYVERVSKVRERSKSWLNDKSMTKSLAAFTLDGHRFGDHSLAAITGDDLELFIQHLKQVGRAASTRNHYVQLMKSMFGWAAKKGYLARNPITEDTELKRSKMARRHRRLEGDEEERLLAVAHPRLQRLIVAAIESGARQGELLALVWADVTSGWIRIRAANAKSAKFREIPMSARLRSVLAMAQHDPAGHTLGPRQHPFGNKIGQRSGSPKKMWETAILKAHGHTPTWRNGSLSPESSSAYRAIDLHFHDLRHEAGSRWLKAGMSLHHVKELLGHSSIATTDTYLNATRVGLQEAMQRIDEHNRCNPVASSTSEGPRLPRNTGQKTDDNSLIH